MTVTAYVGKLENTVIDVPVTNISIDNVPAGFGASLIDVGGTKRIEVQGLAENLAILQPSQLFGSIDATAMTPREVHEGVEGFHSGSYDAAVKWNVPAGITVVNSSMMEVGLYQTPDAGADNGNGTAIVAAPGDEGAGQQTE